MKKTRELLSRPAGGVEPKKDKRGESNYSRGYACSCTQKGSSTSTHGTSVTINGSSSNGNDDEKKWKQKLTDSKIFKRLMQPSGLGFEKKGGGSSESRDHNGESVVPRLGEIPVRSKYYRAEQHKSHFATTADYLPLAEICGPPMPTSSQQQQLSPKRKESNSPRNLYSGHKKHKKRPHRNKRRISSDGDAPYEGMDDYVDQVNDVEDEEGYDEGQESVCTDEYNDDVHFHSGSGADDSRDPNGKAGVEGNVMMEGSLRESLVKNITGSMQQHHHHRSTASCTSAASSIGPTGLPLLPQFRWVPQPGGGGHGFNPFMAFRMSPLPHHQQGNHMQYYGHEHQNVTAATHTVQEQPSYDDSNASPPPSFPQQDEGKAVTRLSTVGAQDGSFDMFYVTPSPGPQLHNASPPPNSFYGPMGSLGIEASHKRRQLELENGSAGDAEKAYKERTFRRCTRYDGSFLIITKAWCDPNTLLGARVIDSPPLPDDVDGDTSSSDSVMITDGDHSNEDLAGSKPPVYDAATMAAREARVRKERIRQERRRHQQSQSPSFYFTGDDLAVPHSHSMSPSQQDGAQRKAASAVARTVLPSLPAHMRSPQTKAKPLPQSSKPVEEEDLGDASSLSSSDNSEDDGNDDDDSSTDSGSDFPSDDSSSSDSGGEEDDYLGSEGGCSPRGGSVVQASAHGRCRQRRFPTTLPDISISASPSAAISRSLVGDAGQYDFMNSSMLEGTGNSLLFPHDENENSIVGTTMLTLMTPSHQPGYDNSLSPVHSGAGARTQDRTGSAAPHGSSKITANATTGSAARGRDLPKEHIASGNGASAAAILRERKRIKQVAAVARANAESPQGGTPRRQQQCTVNSNYDVGVDDLFAYGGSFLLHSARPLYSPTEDVDGDTVAADRGPVSVSPALTDGRVVGSSPQKLPQSRKNNNSNIKKNSTTSKSDYMMSVRNSTTASGPHANHAPAGVSTSACGASDPPSTQRNTRGANANAPPMAIHNRKQQRASPVPLAGIPLGTGGYSNRPSIPALCTPPTHPTNRPAYLTPKPPGDGCWYSPK
ncbi:hypothetical protein ABL78_5907 [Leptomonas seymouri]|uniref:Uncharacterized protein n=1 Tax=Leptomonas seymouri TaxID=5684 RepID=A0A0N1HW74_LEPSE|nr:hypothetical protein ABL78_5907 [Leptomonas seymouri]|eukprot:KPI85045.1 hypothetical protein ABL78_5907 [Leptomonas seymouri]